MCEEWQPCRKAEEEEMDAEGEDEEENEEPADAINGEEHQAVTDQLEKVR